MKAFNPEKELRKIQHGNRNKIIFGVIAILLILGISSSYALYQIRYTKRIIYNKVSPFSHVTFSKPSNVTISPDKALLLSGETKTFTATLPDNYKIDTVSCTNSDSSIKSDNTFSVTYKTSAASVCTVNIKEEEKIVQKPFSDIIKVDNTTIFNDDPGKNIRYVGANPSNYIWFNCDNYDGLNQTTASQKCEKWRIIGLFNNITKVAGGTENLVKIIRAESIGKLVWDSAGTNDWTTATLQTSLNTTYYNGTNLSNGKGITSTTKNMIEYVTWNLGGWATNDYVPISNVYENERGTETNKYNPRPTIWDGYIGLMYPSDYGYATGGGSSTDRNSCLTDLYRSWYKTDCSNNSWLLDSTTDQCTISSTSNNSSQVFYISPSGMSSPFNSTSEYSVRPTLYLKSNVKIVSGDGSSASSGENGPYIITP